MLFNGFNNKEYKRYLAGHRCCEIRIHQDLACEQAFSRAGWGEGKAKRPVDRPLGPPFHGTRCASDPDASSYWQEH